MQRKVAPPAEWVDNAAVGGAGHGVDGEIAPLQILLERHVGRELSGEAPIAWSNLALQARQRVFLMRLGMQVHRKVASHGALPEPLHFLRRCADDHPIALAGRSAEKLIPHGPAYEIHLHARMLTESRMLAGPVYRLNLVAPPRSS